MKGRRWGKTFTSELKPKSRKHLKIKHRDTGAETEKPFPTEGPELRGTWG